MSKVISKAPGRICLFGDHQDYLGLPIIACAINRYITIEGTPNQLNQFEIALPDVADNLILDLNQNDALIEKGEHLKSVLKVLVRYGCIPNKGYTLKITGDIPINAGLSSSSALVVAWTQWLVSIFSATKKITSEAIAQIAYEAEVVEQNSPGGKMDQYSSAIGNIIFLETGKISRVEKLEAQIEGLIIATSGVPKNTIGLLGDLKGNALKAIAIVEENVKSFKIENATLTEYEKHKELLPENLQPYFYAAIQNHLITQKAYIEFTSKKPNIEKIGELMNDHHKVLKNELKITVPEIDQMIEAALRAGAIGAKIVGSGGGGSIAIIAPTNKEKSIIDALFKSGATTATKVKVSKGAYIQL